MVQDERDGDTGDPPAWRDSLRRARQVIERAEQNDTIQGWRARLAGARRIVAWGAAAAVLVLFAAGLLYLYSQGGRAPQPVTVSADQTARRVKPAAEQNPAGIPDAEVYETLRSPSQGKETTSTADKSSPKTSAESAKSTPAAPPSSSPAAPAAPGGAAHPQTASTSEPAAKAPPRPADTPASLSPEEQSEQKRALSGSYAIQIAAFHMRWRAEAFVNRAAFDQADVLKGLSAAIVPAEKDGQTFWRVRYGPFFDRRSAMAKCRDIRAHKLNCIVVRVP